MLLVKLCAKYTNFNFNKILNGLFCKTNKKSAIKQKMQRVYN